MSRSLVKVNLAVSHTKLSYNLIFMSNVFVTFVSVLMLSSFSVPIQSNCIEKSFQLISMQESHAGF